MFNTLDAERVGGYIHIYTRIWYWYTFYIFVTMPHLYNAPTSSIGFHPNPEWHRGIRLNRTILLSGGMCFSLSDKIIMHAQSIYMHHSIPLNMTVLQCMYAVCTFIWVLSRSEEHIPPSSNIARFGGMFSACFRASTMHYSAPWASELGVSVSFRIWGGSHTGP